MPASPSQGITVEPNDRVVHVVVRHKLLDSATSGDLQTTAMTAARGDVARPVVLDLTAVQYMSSMAIGVLVNLMKELRASGQRLMIVGLRQQIRQVLAITHVDRVLDLSEKMDDALAKLTPNPA